MIRGENGLTFLGKCALFLLPLAVLWAFLEIRLHRMPNSYNTKQRLLESRLDSIRVLVLGSSQTLSGVNPERFSCPGFNLANVSQSLFYDTRLALKYAGRMPRLKCVIITISSFSLGYQIGNSREEWRDAYYAHFWGIDHPGLKWHDPRRYSCLMLYTPGTALKFALNGFKTDRAGECGTDGWRKADPVSNAAGQDDSLGRARAEFHTGLYRASCVTDNLRDLHRLLAEWKLRNIVPVFITPPVLPAYSSHADPRIRSENERMVGELCARYGCRYLDYFTDPRFGPGDFNDCDHLNAVGAAKFSGILDDEVIRGLCE